MKRLFTLAILLAVFAMTGSANADSPRKVLFEHFTSASCAPCAAVAPTYYAFIKSNMDKIIPISYHGNYGGDVMEDFWNEGTSSFFQMYGFTGVPSLAIEGNKWKGHPGNLSQYQNLPGTLAAEMSQYTITVNKTKTGIKNDVSVTIESSKKVLNPTTLRVAIVEAYHYYANAGNNGEKDFYFIPRNMLPNASGTKIAKFDANSPKSFDFTYNDNAQWNNTLMYVVVWLQNDADLEIYQAASTPIPDLTGIEDMQTASFTINSTKQASKVHELTEVTKPVTITNPNSFPMKASLLIDESMSYIPEDWTVTLDKSEAMIPAGGSIIANLTVMPGTSAELATINIAAMPIETSGILPVTASYNMYLMSDAVKYAIFNAGMSGNAYAYYSLALSKTMYGQNTAILPFTTSVTTAFTADDFDVAFFTATTPYGGMSYLLPGQIAYMKAMQAKGKHVFVTTDLSGMVKNIADAPAELKTALNDFYTNVAQVEYAGTKSWIVNNTVSPFNINGVDKDTITGTFISQYNNSAQRFATYSEYYTIPQGSPAVSIAAYAADFTQPAGIRLENPNGSKFVLLGFPLEYAVSLQMQQTLLSNAMRWFVGAPEVFNPEILTETSSLQFEQVEIGKSKDITFEVYNLGNADLKITKLEIKDDADGVFEVLNSGLTVVEPDGVTTFTVRFTPKEEKLYNFAKVVIFNNDPIYKQESVSLNGTGILPEATGPRVKLDADSITFDPLLATEFADKEITLTNTGVDELVISEILVTNDEEGHEVFKIISLPPAAIPPSGVFKFRIRFVPPYEGDFTGKFKFASNDTEHSLNEIKLAGHGIHNTSVNDGLFGNDQLTMSIGPNPFVSTTNLKLNVTGYANQDVNISLLDVSGKQVALIVNGTVAPGEHIYNFDGSFLSTGTYYVVAKIGSKTSTMPVAIIK